MYTMYSFEKCFSNSSSHAVSGPGTSRWTMENKLPLISKAFLLVIACTLYRVLDSNIVSMETGHSAFSNGNMVNFYIFL